MKDNTLKNNKARLLETLDFNAKKTMKRWDLSKFCKSHPTLLETILKSMLDNENRVYKQCMTDVLSILPSEIEIKSVADNSFPPRDNVNVPKNEACIFGMNMHNKIILSKFQEKILK